MLPLTSARPGVHCPPPTARRPPPAPPADERSPLCGHTYDSLKALSAEIVVTFEATTEVGLPLQPRQPGRPAGPAASGPLA